MLVSKFLKLKSSINLSFIYQTANFHNIVGRNFLSLKDYSKDEIYQLLWTATDLKSIYGNGEIFEPLKGKSIAMIFEKLSTRTRVSTETGSALMGMHPCFLSPSDIHLGKSETTEDSAKVLSGFSDIILARVYDHDMFRKMAANSSVPLINGLSDKYHPLQLLADLLTLQEHYGQLKGLKVAWIGDGNNNMTHSFMFACGILGLELRIAAPQQYQPDPNITKLALQFFDKTKSKLLLSTDPLEAVSNSDVIVTDTFVSMGREQDKEQRLREFHGFQVNRNLLARASSRWSFLHCLPRKPDEVTDDVFYDKERSLVWKEANNRKWTVMAVILNLLLPYEPKIARPKFE